MKPKQKYFIILDTVEGAFIPCDTKKSILFTYKTEKEARDAFELNYERDFKEASITWAGSAALHWMQLRPFVIALPARLTAIEILTTLAKSHISDLKGYSMSSDAVRTIEGIKVDLETCRNYQVSRVRLIRENATFIERIRRQILML